MAVHNTTSSSIVTPRHVSKALPSASVGASNSSHNLIPSVPNTMAPALDIFSTNASKIEQDILLPMVGEDITTTSQLVACAKLLALNDTTLGEASTNTRINVDDLLPSQIKWTQELNERPLEKDFIRQLMNRMVDEFIDLPNKTPDSIREIVLLGPVLHTDHYRTLLNNFLYKLMSETALNINILQGLIRLVEHTPPLGLRADDLTKILRAIRSHLKDPAQRDPEHTVHLVVAISKVLVIMVDCEVKDLNREEEHEPLLEILSDLKKRPDALMQYLVEYAYTALQSIPDDETLRKSSIRHGLGLAGGLMKVSGTIKLDFGGVSEGLPAVIKNGRGLKNNLKKYFGSGNKNPWFSAVRKAEVKVRNGELVDFYRLICEDDCRQDPFFQRGVCLILSNMAVDPLWDAALRKQAIICLGRIFNSNSRSDKHQGVRRWILTILYNIPEILRSNNAENDAITDNDAIKKQALSLLDKLKDTGNKREFPYQHLRAAINYQHLPTPSILLNKVNCTPDLELVLDRLRHQRRRPHIRQAIYIPLMSKPNSQTPDGNPEPLHGQVQRFLKGNGLVMLILGDSGAGKSTFNAELEQDLWKTYKAGDPIPLFIDLKAVQRLHEDLIKQHLDSLNIFSESHRKDLRSRKFILICDGYDESQSRSNLYTNNQFNKPNQWKVKMVISCRTQYLTSGYRTYFAPQQDAAAHVGLLPTEHFTEAVIVPFNLEQINEYIAQYTTKSETRGNNLRWTIEQYMERLKMIPHIMDLIKNPFLLRMILEILPTMTEKTTRITRAELYDDFVEKHYENEHDRLIEQRSRGKMDSDRLTVFQELEGPSFTELGIDFSKRLADTIFKEQDGVNSVEYWSAEHKESWKRQFFGAEPKTQLLMEASQLVRRTSFPDSQEQTRGKNRSTDGKDTFRFSHSSILEYFYALSIYKSRSNLARPDSKVSQSLADSPPSIADHPLGQRSLVAMPAILQFLADRVKHDARFKGDLHNFIERSKTDASASCAASNAITILIRAGERFNGADLSNIRIPGADLSGGDFDSAQLEGANLKNTNLRNIWLRQANLHHCEMEGAAFGEYLYLEVQSSVRYCAFSPDEKHVIVGLEEGVVDMYETSGWTEVKIGARPGNKSGSANSRSDHEIVPRRRRRRVRPFAAHTQAPASVNTRVAGAVLYSPDLHQIASRGPEWTVLLWDVETDTLASSLIGHTDFVSSVAYSPSGHQIATGSWDNTVRLWDAHTGGLIYSLLGHSNKVTSVVFSPSGHQIASGSGDQTVRLWDVQKGELKFSMDGHSNNVTSVAFSPSGLQIASGSYDETVQLWDVQTGELMCSLVGHSNSVTSVVFSPSGLQIATGSYDKTVRLWDATTGAIISCLSGHTGHVTSVAYSPNGQLIASGSEDKTARLWDAPTGTLASSVSAHTNSVAAVACSPSSHQIASGSWDNTVRLWEAQNGAVTLSLNGHTQRVSSVAYSPDGHQIASGSYDKTVKLWDAHTGVLVFSLTGHTHVVSSVVYSPNGHQIASGSWDTTVRLWNAQTGDLITSMIGHTHQVVAVVYSPSGHQIATGSWDRDNTIRLWDAQTGAHTSSLIGHTHKVNSVAYSPTGHQIASGSQDNTVRLWDAQSGTLISTLKCRNHNIISLAYSPNGRWIASGSEKRTVHIWDLDSGERLLALGRKFQGIPHSISWKETQDSFYLIIGDSDRSVRSWKVTENGQELRVCLHWRSNPDTLVLADADFRMAQGVNTLHRQLFKQRQAKYSKSNFRITAAHVEDKIEPHGSQ